MSKIINFKEKIETVPDNLITSKPWEFRRPDRESKHFIQMSRSRSIIFEKRRKEIHKKGDKRIRNLPEHFILKGSMAHTIKGIYSYRNNEEKMKEVYYLAGLIDCMINRVNPLLRTDLIRDMYKKITTLKIILNINWYGHMDQVLFPIDAGFYNELEYIESLQEAGTMRELHLMIKEGTGEMFDILSSEYIFFTPGRGA